MLKRIFVSLAVLAIVGCAGNPPIIDYDPSIDFAKYRTFAFIGEHPLIRGEGAETGSPLLEGRLMQITENVLLARGFERVANPESADVAIAFTVGGRDKIQVNSYPEPYRGYYGGGYRGGWGGSYHSYGMSTSTSVQQYTEGTLAVDIYDVKEHHPIWHGKATRRVTKKMQENPQETLTEIMTEILASFPPM
jgi:hypothetical protein